MQLFIFGRLLGKTFIGAYFVCVGGGVSMSNFFLCTPFLLSVSFLNTKTDQVHMWYADALQHWGVHVGIKCHQMFLLSEIGSDFQLSLLFEFRFDRNDLDDTLDGLN